MKNHLNIYNIILIEQHGFQKHCSSDTQLMETLNYPSSNFYANNQTCFLLYDVSKGSDKSFS